MTEDPVPSSGAGMPPPSKSYSLAKMRAQTANEQDRDNKTKPSDKGKLS